MWGGAVMGFRTSSACRRWVVLNLLIAVTLTASPSTATAIQATPAASPDVAQRDLATLEGTITADGSSTVLPITDEVALLFQELAGDVQVEVDFSGTGGGFLTFCNGETDIQNASRPIEADEEAACAANGIGYYAFPVAFDGITIVVNKTNDFVTCLTVDQLRMLWQPEGPAMTWQDLDPAWPNRTIELYGPGPLSGTFDYFTAVIVGEEGSSRTDYFPSENDLDLVEGVEDRRDSLGYFGYAYYQDEGEELKAVAVDAGRGCVTPSPTTIADGSYRPLSRPLYVYVKAESLERAEVQEFLRFYLASAGEIATDVGYVPLPAEDYAAQQAKLEQAIGGTLPPDAPGA